MTVFIELSHPTDPRYLLVNEPPAEVTPDDAFSGKYGKLLIAEVAPVDLKYEQPGGVGTPWVRPAEEAVDKVAELTTIDRSDADTLKFDGLDELVYLDTEFDWGKLVCGAEYKFRAERDMDGDLVLMEIEAVGPEV